MKQRRHLYGACAALLIAASAGAQAEWPQWRGPGGAGRADSTAPSRWGPEENVLWRTPLEGRGHSSPIVVGDLLFVTSAVAGDPAPDNRAIVHFLGGEEFLHPDSMGADQRIDVLLLALERESGAVRWRRVARSGALPYDNRHRVSSYANPTPVSDGERVIVWFGTHGLHAFDLGGEPVWERDFGGVGTVGMGVGVSPVLVEGLGLVVIQNDVEQGEGSFLLAVDTASGDVRWRVDRGERVGWATPVVATASDGAPVVVTVGTTTNQGYDASTGALLWESDGLGGNAVPSPVPSGEGVVFAATGYPRKRVVALDVSDGKELWEYRKGQGYVPSPAYHRGLLYLVSDGGILTALDGATGEIVYEGGRMPLPSRFFSSPVIAGERLYLTSEDGDTHVIRTGPRFQVLATNSLDEPVMASPVVVDGAMYLRGVESLYAIAPDPDFGAGDPPGIR